MAHAGTQPAPLPLRARGATACSACADACPPPCFARRSPQIRYHTLFARHHRVIRQIIIGNIYRTFLFGQVTDMTNRGNHGVAFSQVFFNRFGFGRRFYNY
jgi:hypothetical protein